MSEPTKKQLTALAGLRKLVPDLSVEWDEDTGTPWLLRGTLSPPAPPVGAQSVADASLQAAYAFLERNADLYRISDASEDFPRSRVVGNENGTSVRVFQLHRGVPVYDGGLSVALDAQNRVTQVLGRHRPDMRLSTEPQIPEEKAIQIAQADLVAQGISNRDVSPVTARLLVLNTGSFPSIVNEAGKRNHLAWRVELLVWVYFVDARDGSIIFTYDNTQTARDRRTHSTDNCYALPGLLWLDENGPVEGRQVDDIAWSAHRHSGVTYDYHLENFGLDSFDGNGFKIVSTVHSGIPNGFYCDQNNAAFIPTMLQFVYGDGDGGRFGPFAHALDVVAHEIQHAVTYFAITWPDGAPRGLDYEGESGALNESYSDFFGSIIEGKDWLVGEDCYTPQTPDDAVRDMADPAKYGQPDHYSKYVTDGSESYKVHVNSGIMNKAGYLMCDGGTHYGITVLGMGKEAAVKIWYRALTHHLQGTSGLRDARAAMLQSCHELFPGDDPKLATVQNTLAAVGIGDPAPPPRISVDPRSVDFGTVRLGENVERTITVRNTGTGALVVAAIHSSDPAFSIGGDTSFRVEPGASRTVSVQLAATTAGPLQAQLDIQSNDGSEPSVLVALSVSIVGVPEIAVEPGQMNFGSVNLGESGQQTLTVRNTGSAELAVTSIQCSEPAFAVQGDTAFQLQPGGSQDLGVLFTPTAVGEQQANLTIQSSDTQHPTVTIPLSGTAVGISNIAVEPARLDFGEVTVGQSAQLTLAVRNTGTAVLNVSAVESSAAAFAVDGDTVFQLQPGASRDLPVVFAPTTVGEKQASLTIRSDDIDEPSVTVALSGTALGSPRIAVEPVPLDFGSVALGASDQRSVAVQNTGSAVLDVSAVESSGPEFVVDSAVSFQVDPGASMAVQITFTPTEPGSREATLTIRSNDIERTAVTVPLVGTAVGVPRISVEPVSIDFGQVPLGESAQRSLQVRNDGTGRLTVSSIESSDPSVVVQGETAFELEPAAVRSLTLTFSPTALGTVQASLSVRSDDADQSLLTVPLSGVATGVSNIVVEPTQVDFGGVPIGQSAAQILSVRNTGSEALSISSIQTSDPAFTVQGETVFRLEPDASRELVVSFAPTSGGAQQASLAIQSDDPDEPTVTVSLSGSGLGVPRVAVEPSQLQFGDVALGQSAEQSLTVHNTGTANLVVHDIQSGDPAFGVTGATSFELAPGDFRDVAITFSPAASGALQATLSILSNDPEQPAITVALAGTGAGEPDIVVETTEIGFGEILVGQSVQQPLVVQNSGTAVLTVSSIQSSEPAFTVEGETSFQLQPEGSRELVVAFSPGAAGTQQAILTILSNDVDQPSVTIALSGAAIGVPDIAVEPTHLDFGQVALGQSAQQTLTVRNTGSADLDILAIQTSDPAYAVQGESEFSLQPQASRELVVAFTPTALGEQQANLTIDSNASDQPTSTITLAGTAIGRSNIAVEPLLLDFGPVVVGRSAQQTVTVRNTGSATLRIASVQSSDPAFTFVGGTEFELDPGALRELDVTFVPTTVGAHQAELSVQSDAPDEPTVTVALSGTALGAPDIAVEPAQLNFGQVVVGRSAQRTLAVHNHGTDTLEVSSIRCSDAAFTVVEGATFQLAAGGTQQVLVAFSPVSVGDQQCVLSIQSNDADQPIVTVALSATAAGLPRIEVAPDSIDFGQVGLGESAQQSLAIRNSGSAELQVSDLQSSEPDFAVTGDTEFQLAPGDSREVGVAFVPSAVGAQQAALTIPSNDPEQPTFTVALSGIAFGVSNIVVQPSRLDFGQAMLGQTTQQTLSIQNSGSAELNITSVRSNDPAFTVEDDTTFALDPGAAVELTVSFAPASVGAHQANLNIESDDIDEPTVTVALSGLAVGVPDIAVEPYELDFGDVAIGQAAERSIAVRNYGTGALDVSGMETNDAAFAIEGDHAFQVDAGASVDVVVTFSPSVVGGQQAVLSIESNDSDQPVVTIHLTGTATGVPHIDVQPTDIDFGQVALGQATQQTLTVRNSGNATLAVSDIESSEPAFTVAGDAGFQLEPDTAKDVLLQFSPTVVGEQQASLSILSNDSERPTLSVRLRGTALGVPNIVVAPAQLEFDEVPLGRSAERTLTVRNAGSAELMIHDIRCDSPTFVVSGDTTFPLAGGTARDLIVTFSPEVLGEQQATMHIESNDPDEPTVTVLLSGVSIGVPRIAVEPHHIDFGTVMLKQDSERSFTIRSTGFAALTVQSIESNEPAFTVEGETSFRLEPQEQRELIVRFLPTAVGEQQANLNIHSNDSDHLALFVTLAGQAIGQSNILVEPTILDFGRVRAGQSEQRTFVVRNSGWATLNVSSVESSQPAFAVGGDTSFQLAPEASHAVPVTFSPLAKGEYQANVAVRSDDIDEPTVTVGLSGGGIGMPRIEVKPAEISFGLVTVGQASERSLTVRSRGTDVLHISAIESSDPAFAAPDSAPFELVPESDKILQIRFTPTSAGQAKASLAIHSDDADQPVVRVALAGSGAGVPLVAVEPTRIHFDAIFVGLTAQRAFNVRNIGSGELRIHDIRPSDPAFAVEGETAFEVNPGASKALSAKFSPLAPGEHTGTLTVRSNDAERPSVTVALSGTGLKGPQIVARPENLDFGAVPVGQSEELDLLRIANVGGHTLEVSALRIDEPAFSALGDTAFKLEPGASRGVTLRFAPAHEGLARGRLAITSNDPKTPTLSLGLVGLGETKPIETPRILLDPLQFSFGSVPVGQSAQRTLTVNNAGMAELTVSRVDIAPGDYSLLELTPFSVEAHSSQGVAVEYRPLTEAVHPGKLVVFSNDPLEPQVTVILLGNSTRCFATTAAYGSPMQKQLRTLRALRDESLVHSARGRSLVSLYYRWNDVASALIANNRVGRAVARWLLRIVAAVARRLVPTDERRPHTAEN